MKNPDLSVVLVNKFGLDRLRRIFASLGEQSIANRLEVVVVSPFDAPPEEQSPFLTVRYVKCGSVDSMGPPRAEGIQACSAPFFIFGEDHCFPRPGWAAAILGRMREGWTGVGPLILNNNPSTLVSRAEFLLNYGCFSPGCQSGSVSYIPPHNSAYRTDVVQALGPALPGLLQMDHHLQARLLSDGGRLFLESSAQAVHTNLSRPLAHWSSQFHGSRIYGATRAEYDRWPAHRRVIYAAAFLGISALRLARACSMLEDWRALPILPLLTIAATIAGAGEASGYLFGADSSLLHRVDEELDRPSGIIDAERHLLLP